MFSAVHTKGHYMGLAWKLGSVPRRVRFMKEFPEHIWKTGFRMCNH